MREKRNPAEKTRRPFLNYGNYLKPFLVVYLFTFWPQFFVALPDKNCLLCPVDGQSTGYRRIMDIRYTVNAFQPPVPLISNRIGIDCHKTNSIGIPRDCGHRSTRHIHCSNSMMKLLFSQQHTRPKYNRIGTYTPIFNRTSDEDSELAVRSRKRKSARNGRFFSRLLLGKTKANEAATRLFKISRKNEDKINDEQFSGIKGVVTIESEDMSTIYSGKPFVRGGSRIFFVTHEETDSRNQTMVSNISPKDESLIGSYASTQSASTAVSSYSSYTDSYTLETLETPKVDEDSIESRSIIRELAEDIGTMTFSLVMDATSCMAMGCSEPENEDAVTSGHLKTKQRPKKSHV